MSGKMKVKDLIKSLEGYEEFDLEFHFMEFEEGEVFPNTRKFRNINIDDVGYSDKIVLISGEEK